MTHPTLQRWHDIVRTRDPRGLEDLLSDDVTFWSPVVHSPQQGKRLARLYLEAALHVLGNDSFRYLNEWHAERSAVLEFETTIDGIVVNGIDMIEWGDDDRIRQFKVMVRPLKAIQIVHQTMAERLAAQVPGRGSR